MKWIGAILTAAALGIGALPNPQAGCADPNRRSAAIVMARAINDAEAAAFRGQRSYKQIDGLPVGTPPPGTTLQLTTDGDTYAFSIKDTDDPCRAAIFSDQTGVIYAAAPIR